MSVPSVSIIIPSYNHERYLQTAVESVLQQTFRDLELIIIDDGSTDGSRAILERINDPRVQVVAQENRGAHATIDRGIRMARAPYVTILNSDDRFLPNRLDILMAQAAAHPNYALLGSYIRVIDADGALLGIKEGYHTLDPWPVPEPARTFKADGDLRTALLIQNYWATTSNMLFPRHIYERFGPFRNLRYAHDWDFALQVQRDHEAYLHPEPLMEYRVHASNTIRDNRAAMIYEVCWILAYHLLHYTSRPSFWNVGVDRRTEQLQHSIYVYGCDAVFWQMQTIMQSLSEDGAHTLLDTTHPVRQRLLATIQSLIEVPQIQTLPAPDPVGAGGRTLASRMRSLLSRTRS